MTKNSDLSLLLTVLTLPLFLAIGMAVAAWGFGQTFGADTVAMFMMMILMFSALSAQSLGKKALDTGPRAVARYLGFALGMFGMVIIGQVPPAEMTLGQMLQGWLWFPAILLFGPALAAIKPLRAMRRHPRGLWILARQGAIAVTVVAIIAASVTWWREASPAQGVWVFWVMLGAGSSGGVTFGAYRGQRSTRLGKLAFALAEAIPFAALMVVVIYVFELGQSEGIAALPFGTFAGVSIFFLVLYYSKDDEKASV